MARLAAEVEALDLPVDSARLVAALPAAALVAAVLAFALLGASGVVLLVATAAVSVLARRRSAPRRLAAATEHALPGVLDGIARHLRAGGSLAQAIATTQPPPSAPDLVASWDRLTALVPVIGVTAALDDWCRGDATTTTRPPPPRSIGLAAAALSLAATTGGSPARAIDGVAATLRSRLAVADEIRALSSQARASAAVIALAPIVFGLLAGLSDPRARSFFASAPGLALLALGLALDALGAAWMARLCRPPAP